METDKKLLKPAHAAALLDCSAGLIYRYIREGKLAVRYIGTAMRITGESLDALVESLPTTKREKEGE